MKKKKNPLPLQSLLNSLSSQPYDESPYITIKKNEWLACPLPSPHLLDLLYIGDQSFFIAGGGPPDVILRVGGHMVFREDRGGHQSSPTEYNGKSDYRRKFLCPRLHDEQSGSW